MQLAQVLRADLDRELMDEVHASRAARRDTRPTCSCDLLANIHLAAECDALAAEYVERFAAMRRHPAGSQLTKETTR